MGGLCCCGDYDADMDFDDLLSISPPTDTVKIGSHSFELKALSSVDLDELITRYPPPKDSNLSFSEDMRFELVARCLTNITLTTDQVRELVRRWSQGQGNRLTGAAFDLNFRDTGASVPL